MSLLSKIRTETPYVQIKNNAFLHASDRYWIKKGTDGGIIIDYDVPLQSYGGINLQRPFVWTLEQKQEFILSILKRIDIPKVSTWIESIYKTEDHTEGKKTVTRHVEAYQIYHIIDGKQRINAYLSFIENEYPIEVEGTLYFYKDLDEPTKYEFDWFVFTVDCAKRGLTDKQKVEWFSLINFAGTAQDKEHMETLKKAVK
jgi:Protein of unknown function DUF262